MRDCFFIRNLFSPVFILCDLDGVYIGKYPTIMINYLALFFSTLGRVILFLGIFSPLRFSEASSKRDTRKTVEKSVE